MKVASLLLAFPLLLHGAQDENPSHDGLRRGLFYQGNGSVDDKVDGSFAGSFYNVTPPAGVGQPTPAPNVTPPPTPAPLLEYSIQQETANEIKTAVDLAVRVYKFKLADDFPASDGEYYFEHSSNQDAYALREEADKCFVSFRGTKPPAVAENSPPDDWKGNLLDVLDNLGLKGKTTISSIDGLATCTVTQDYHDAYKRLQADVESKVAEKCNQKKLILTGHSQGTAIAQMAALRFKNLDPQLYLFAPAPIFFDSCDAVPAERILNFVNTEVDDGFMKAFQYDIIPFVDVFLKYPSVSTLVDAVVGVAQFGEFVRETFGSGDALRRMIKNAAEGNFVGSYKGLYIVLHPEVNGDASFVSSRNLLIDENTEVDVFDFEEFAKFLVDPDNNKFEIAVNTHDPFKYQAKVDKLFEQAGTTLVNGFDVGEPCPVGNTPLCRDTCVKTSNLALKTGVCSDFSPGSPGGSCTPGLFTSECIEDACASQTCLCSPTSISLSPTFTCAIFGIPAGGNPGGQPTPAPNVTPPPTNPFLEYSVQQETANEIKTAVDLAVRVYKFKLGDNFTSAGEYYFEHFSNQDAYALREEADKCFVSFRGTKPPGVAEDPTNKADWKGNLLDVFDNLGLQGKTVIKSIDELATCSVTVDYREAYRRLEVDVEKKVADKCNQKKLILTGHSQGTAIAQMAAVRFKNLNPQLYLFAPAPIFFDSCDAVPAERILNFVNTEVDTGFGKGFQYDIIPFVDVFLRKPIVSTLVNAVVGAAKLGEFVRETFGSGDDLRRMIKNAAEGNFVGSYKGLYIVLHPEVNGDASFVSSRNLLIDENTEVDVFDIGEFAGFIASGGNDKFELAFNTHDPFKYQAKVDKLFEQAGTTLVNGFDVGEPCPVGNTPLCREECVASYNPLLKTGVCSDKSFGSPGGSCTPRFFTSECTEDACASQTCLCSAVSFTCGVRGF